MGTRGLTMVINKEGETKVAQYGQWDHYPSGQGCTALHFLSNAKLDEFQEKLKKVRFTNEEDEKKMKEFSESIGCKDGWMDMKQADLYHKKYPYFTRDHGAGILDLISESKDEEILLCDSTSFAADSLFCEYAYVIDFSKNTFEIYEGFNQSPLAENERFFSIENTEKEYYPVRLIKSYPLDNLPTKAAFLEDLDPKEDDE